MLTPVWPSWAIFLFVKERTIRRTIELKNRCSVQDRLVRRLTPLFYQHINPYGTFRLHMSERMQIEEEEAMA